MHIDSILSVANSFETRWIFCPEAREGLEIKLFLDGKGKIYIDFTITRSNREF